MARKRYSDEDCLKVLRQVELQLAAGSEVVFCLAERLFSASYPKDTKACGQGISF